MQKLMTKEIESKVAGLYEQDGKGKDAIVYAHYFSCWSGWDWYVLEYDPETHDCFGIVKGFETEYGYFSLDEMAEINRQRGFEFIERETYFEPCRVEDLHLDM